MLIIVLILFCLVSTCVVIHGAGMVFGLRWLVGVELRSRGSLSLLATFRVLSGVVSWLLVLHLLQILAWAFCYEWGGCFPDFFTSFYYSATSYSTVGYGDVIPAGNWKLVGSIEAVTGVLMFGWSTGVLFAVVNRLMSRFTEPLHRNDPR